jgi:hypothetical protein
MKPNDNELFYSLQSAREHQKMSKKAIHGICKAWAAYQIAKTNCDDLLNELSDRIIEAERVVR